MQFRCPIDRATLSGSEATVKCPSGHSFDRAKEGYFNLLLVQQKNSLDPGDSKEMVEARRRFLEAGYYAPIADKLVGLSKNLTFNFARPQILDAGCGEGYYLSRIQSAISKAELTGIDISKWAVKSAAKSNKEISWAVASNKQIPLEEKSQVLILCLFGFPFWESFRSILNDNGCLILVDPAPEHLRELRELIYERVNETNLSKIDGAYAAGFSLVSEEKLSFSITLEQNSAIQDLLAMTPHGYRMNAEARARIVKLSTLKTTVSVAYRILKKNA